MFNYKLPTEKYAFLVPNMQIDLNIIVNGSTDQMSTKTAMENIFAFRIVGDVVQKKINNKQRHKSKQIKPALGEFAIDN